jgi:WD40 repeat protein
VAVPVYDMRNLEAGGAVVIPTVGALAFCLAPGGKTCAYGTLKELVLMDVQSGKAKHTFKDTGGQPWSASFSPDGKLLACGTGSGRKQVVVWDVANLKAVHTFKVSDIVQGLAFSQNSKVLAASANDTVTVWDLAGGTEVLSFRGPANKLMRGLAFGAGGKVLASVCSDGTVTLRAMPSGNVLDTINIGVEAYRVTMSADGRVLAVTADDQFARVYDVSAIVGK